MKQLVRLLFVFAPIVAAAQDAVDIRVDATVRQGPFKPVFSYFGYDEPNYRYQKNGAKLIAELAQLSRTPVYIRAHHLLCTGDGTPGLKWGSTNAYTEDASGHFESIFPQFRALPIIVSEYDPEGSAACSARDHPQNAYRDGTVYPTYTAASIKNVLLLAGRYQANIEGMLTWAFEFEGQPYFDGFRTLATNGIDKPVLNVFRMAGLLRGDLLKVTSSGAVGLVGAGKSDYTMATCARAR